MLNFDEILLELSYRVESGIVDLTKSEQVQILEEILIENGIDNASEVAQKARVYFSYLNESVNEEKKGQSTKYPGYFHRGAGYYSKTVDGEITHKSEKGSKSLKALSAKEKSEKNKTVTPTQTKKSVGSTSVFPTKGKKSVSQKKKVKNNGPAVEVQVSSAEEPSISEKGAKEVDSKKFKSAKKGKITKSRISQKQAFENIRKKYGIKPHSYNYPPGVQKYLKAVMHPAAYEAMDTLIRLSKGGDFIPPISLITTQFGAGKISAQMNELCMQAIMSFPNTPAGKKQRDNFIQSLKNNNQKIKSSGGKEILDDTWIDQFKGAHDAFCDNMDRMYGQGKWKVVGTTWDVRSQNEDMGINYDDKGFSTDINLQIQVDGQFSNVEVSCKKDWKIFLLNGGLGKAENWHYTLGEKDEKRATLLTQKAEEKTITKEEAEELIGLNERALKSAPVSNKKLQTAQLKSAQTMATQVHTIKSNQLDEMFKKLIKGDYPGGKDKQGKPKQGDDPEYLKAAIACHKKVGIKNQDKFMECLSSNPKTAGKTGDKYYKKAVVLIGQMVAAVNPNSSLATSYQKHISITRKFITGAANIMANDKEYRKMILRKLQEAIPFKSLSSGVESMQIDGMYITKDHMKNLFGTDNWDDIKKYLDVKVVNGQARLIFKAKTKQQTQPISLALISIREKGLGYDGNPALEVKPTDEFEERMRNIDDGLHKRKK